jgi:sodium transport system permease protein
MRFRTVWIIFRKEITETLRDRRTLLMMVGLPILLYPLMMIGLTKLQQAHSEAQEARTSKVAVWGEMEPALLEWLQRTNILAVEPWSGAPESLRRELAAGAFKPPETSERPGASTPDPASGPSEEVLELDSPLDAAARSVVASREIDAVLVVWPGFGASLEEGGLGNVSIYFDSVRDTSAVAQERLHEALQEFRAEQLEWRERERGLAKGFSTAIRIFPTNLAGPSRRLGQIIGSVLPFLLIIMSASGGLYAAIDLTAGEKERNTMQTLLCAPLHYTEIIGGKFLAAWTIVLITALANITSMAATFSRIIGPLQGFAIAPSTYLLSFVMLLPVTFTITAVFLAVAVFAKDFKDGQNFLTPVFMALLLPLGATLLPGTELNAWTALVPIVNVALLIKSLFLAEARADLIFLTLVSSLIYALLTLVFAARVFYREQVLLGGRESVRSLFQETRPKGGMPTPAFALAAFGLIFVGVFYGTLWLEQTGIIPMVLITQYGFFLLPTLLLAGLMRFSPRQTFSLRWPPWQGVVAAVLIGLSAWSVVAGLVVRLLPPPDSLVEGLSKMLMLGDQPLPLWTVWLVLALTPALCEEFFFRGLILSGLRRLGMWPAILITALLFGLAHSSIYRLLPTLLLGVVIGFVVWRTGSILCGIIVHALNNGLLVTFLHLEFSGRKLGFTELTYLPWSLTLAGAGVLVGGLWLLRSLPRTPEAPST